MNIYKNARLTPSDRAELARIVLQGRQSIAQAQKLFTFAPRPMGTGRFRQVDAEGMADRSAAAQAHAAGRDR